MIRRRLGRNGPIGPAIAMALILAISNLRPGAVATFAQGLAPAVVGEAPAGKGAGQPRSYTAKVIEKGTKRPIAGATVKVRRLRFPDPETGGRRILQETTHRTNAEGIYHFAIPPEQLAEPRFGLILDVKHFDYPPETNFHYDFSNSLRLEAFGDRSSDGFDIELQRGEPITGVVVTPDGKPAAGVLVHCSSYFAPEAKPGNLVIACIDDVRTDDRGRFRFVMVTPGEGELSFYPERLRGLDPPAGGKQARRPGTVRAPRGDHPQGPGARRRRDAAARRDREHERVRRASHGGREAAAPRGRHARRPLALGHHRRGGASSRWGRCRPRPTGCCPVEFNNDPLRGETFRRLPAPSPHGR